MFSNVLLDEHVISSVFSDGVGSHRGVLGKKAFGHSVFCSKLMLLGAKHGRTMKIGKLVLYILIERGVVTGLLFSSSPSVRILAKSRYVQKGKAGFKCRVIHSPQQDPLH